MRLTDSTRIRAQQAETLTIESMISICGDHAADARTGGRGRWRCAGMVEAARQVPKVDGFMYLPRLRACRVPLCLQTAATPTRENGGRDRAVATGQAVAEEEDTTLTSAG